MISNLYNFANGNNNSVIIDFDLINGETDSLKALYAGNWNHRASDQGNYKNSFEYTQTGIRIIKDKQALILKFPVEDFGSYKVNLKISNDNADNIHTTIFTGRRNLVKNNFLLTSSTTISFYSYVTPYIPALTYKPIYDKSLYISVVGLNTVIEEVCIEKANVNTIFIAGDSTLTDQNALTPYYPICSCGGWAQSLLSFTKGISVCNYAHSGLTTNCFRDDGHWDILKNQIKPGDIFMLQFGHNDQKRRNLNPYKGYYDNLIWYINQIRELGAYPIICSPISRVPISDSEETYSLLEDFEFACKKACEALNVPFINLHAFTFNKWIKMSSEEIKNYFIPGDITHTNDYGAYFIAKYVSEELKKNNKLCSYFHDEEATIFSPENADLDYPIEKNTSSPFDIDMPFMDISGLLQDEYLSLLDAFKKGLMDPCVMHIHPDAFMPRAQLLMIYLRAIKLNGARPYLGKYKDIYKHEWDSSFVQACINENLIDEVSTENNLFRPDDWLTYGEFASFIIRGMQENPAKRNIDFLTTFEEAKNLELINNHANINDYILRKEVYIGLAKLMNLKNDSNKAMPSDTEMHPVH